jgi:PIN domain nuclease of toxin-antitoxin system
VSYLIDTNGWIAFFEDAPELSNRAAEIIESRDLDCFVSIASVWEAAIKVGIGKLVLPYDLRRDLPRLFDECGFQVLPISMEDSLSVGGLEAIHGDPFDRMQVVQASARQLKVISRDAIFDRYGLKRIW